MSSQEQLSNSEAAKYIGITAGTLHVWRCENRYSIPFLRIGSKIRYLKSDLDAFLQSRRVVPVERLKPRRRGRTTPGTRRGSR